MSSFQNAPKEAPDGDAQQTLPDPALVNRPLFPPPFVVNPTGAHVSQSTIILLHGRNGSGAEFAAELFESRNSEGKTLLELLPGYRWVFPSARATFSDTFKEDLNQWYDVDSLQDPFVRSGVQTSQLKMAVSYVHELVRQEQTMVGNGKVILGGISQGFSVAIIAALVDMTGIDALVGFASWLLFHPVITSLTHNRGHSNILSIRDIISQQFVKDLNFASRPASNDSKVSIFLAHCIDDDVVDVEHGRKLKQELEAMEHQVTWVETERGGHWINEPHCIDELLMFLATNCPSTHRDNSVQGVH